MTDSIHGLLLSILHLILVTQRYVMNCVGRPAYQCWHVTAEPLESGVEKAVGGPNSELVLAG